MALAQSESDHLFEFKLLSMFYSDFFLNHQCGLLKKKIVQVCAKMILEPNFLCRFLKIAAIRVADVV